MAWKFNPGDMVRIKGGTTSLVVERYLDAGVVVCWRENPRASGQPMACQIPEAVLEKVPDKPPAK